MARLLVCLIIILTAAAEARADIIINGFTDATNDRFTNSAGFVGAGLDFSGVGRGAGDAATGSETPTQIRWGTLVSRNVIVSANHFSPCETNVNNTMSFYRNNNSGDEVVRSIVSSERIGSTDLFLSRLNSAVPEDIKIYDFANEELNEEAYDEDTNSTIYNAGSFQNVNAYLLGISRTSRPDSDSRFDQAVGRNRISGYIEDFPFLAPDNDVLVLIQDSPGDPNFVTSEARFSGGDSGAPLFIERDGELLLLGTNSFISTGSPQLSAVSYIGNQSAQINAFITASAVPEPGVGTGLFIFGLATLSKRRRR